MDDTSTARMTRVGAVETYRYLRLGIVAVVAALFVSLGFERIAAECWQTSISAYYFTPARAFFVGGLIAIGFSLIVIKGSTLWEDVFLNFAGMLAPVVALVPTTDAGVCWSEPPPSLPRDPATGELAGWLVANIDNNMATLFVAGALGLTLGAIVASIHARNPLAFANEAGSREKRIGLTAALAFIGAGAALYYLVDGADRRAHGYAAVGMFGLLAVAIAITAFERTGVEGRARYAAVYALVSFSMIAAGVVLLTFFGSWDHMVLVLETIEILLFATFWLIQTYEHWNEGPGPVTGPRSSSISGAREGTQR